MTHWGEIVRKSSRPDSGTKVGKGNGTSAESGMDQNQNNEDRVNNNDASMKVKTKYNLGEKVWFMDQNRPQCSDIRYIYIRVNDEGQYSVSYLVHDESTQRAEDTLYSTKKELLKTL